MIREIDNKIMRCAVIGHGSWATTLVKVLVENGSFVSWYVSNPEVRKSLLSTGKNCHSLPDVMIDMHHIKLSDDINNAVLETNVVFLVTPAAYLKDNLFDLHISLNDKLVASAIKGIIPDENQFVTDYIRSNYGLTDGQVVFICGPTHAQEVSHNKLTYLTVACHDIEKAQIIGKLIRTKYIKIQYNMEVHCLEFFSAMKNIYAVMTGIALGMGYGDNFIAALVSNIIAEIYQLMDLQSMDDFLELNPSAFLGDLLVSCYSDLSRNRQFGILVGTVRSVKTALEQMTMVAEGYSASKVVTFMPESFRKKTPIAELAYLILHKDMPIDMAIEQLKRIVF